MSRRLVFALLGLAGCRHPGTTLSELAPPVLVEQAFRPESLDPRADRWLQDELAYPPAGGARAGKLVVYLVGANNKPVGGREMGRALARMGFHVVLPMYANDYDIRGLCAPARDPDPDCHGKLRLEAFEGIDHSPHIQVTVANSAERRVTVLLEELRRRAPGDEWAVYLDGSRPRWSSIVIGGHSHGASSAGLIGKVRQVDRVVMLSGPFDNRDGAPAAWTNRPPLTPLDRYFAFSHVAEEQHRQHLEDWRAMGLGGSGAPVTVDGIAPPYGGSHQLVTALPPPEGKTPHGVTAIGASSPRDDQGRYRLEATFQYLFGRPAR